MMSSALATETPAKALRRKRRHQPALRLSEVQPGGAHRNEGMLDPRVLGQPVGDWAAQLAGEVIGDEGEIALGIGPVKGLQEREVASRVAGGRGLGEDLAGAHAQCAVDPDLLQATLIIQRHLDAVAIRGPAGGWGEVPGGYGAELIDTDDGRPVGRCGVERDNAGPFGTKS